MKILYVLATSAIIFGVVASSSAHEGECPYCKLKLVQNTKDQDNEVVVKFGNKRIEYRCVFCVLKDQARYKSDLVVYAPSEKIGEPVVLKRKDGKWLAPENSVYLYEFKKHEDCCAMARAFTNRAAFDHYVTDHKISDAKAMTFDQFSDAVAKAKDRE